MMNLGVEDKNAIEPYRPFFFVGSLYAFFGVLLWLLFQVGILNVYPLQAHRQIMLSGFLTSFISGFLMTAVPKMLGVRLASRQEIYLGLALVALQLPLVLSGLFIASSILFCLQILFLVTFFFRRWILVKRIPFTGFLYVPVALAIGFIGSLIMALTEAQWVSGDYYFFGKTLFQEAFALNLILGIGSRLIPVLSRCSQAVMPNIVSKRDPWAFVELLVLNSTFFLQEIIPFNYILLVRGVTILFIVTRRFRIFEKRTVFSYLGLSLRASALLLSLGYILGGLMPQYWAGLNHIIFIGGFALITLMVAIRVILSHGGYDLSFEVNSRLILWASALVISAMGLRVLYSLIMNQNVLMAGVTLWMISFIIWAGCFWKKIWLRNSNSQC